MDTEALKIVLKLQEENAMLKRAIKLATALVKTEREFLTLPFPYGGFDDPYELKPLFVALHKLLFEKEKEPANNSKDTNENAG